MEVMQAAYRSPCMTEEFCSFGFQASQARVERLMREDLARVRHKKRYRVMTNSKHKLPVAPNLLERKFSPSVPNRLFSSRVS